MKDEHVSDAEIDVLRNYAFASGHGEWNAHGRTYLRRLITAFSALRLLTEQQSADIARLTAERDEAQDERLKDALASGDECIRLRKVAEQAEAERDAARSRLAQVEQELVVLKSAESPDVGRAR